MKRILLSVVAGLCLLAPTLAVNQGEAAPSLDLPALAGSPAAVGSGPMLVWLTCGNADDLSQAATLASLASQNGAQLVIIPVTGSDTARAQAIVDKVPGATVLSDPDGHVILSYAGEFIPGVCPNPNLFVISSAGSIAAIRQYPGVAPSSLSTILSQAR